MKKTIYSAPAIKTLRLVIDTTLLSGSTQSTTIDTDDDNTTSRGGAKTFVPTYNIWTDDNEE